MRRLRIIGIGAGDPEHITVQAITALNETDVVFVIEKGAEDLVALRRQICERHIALDHRYRVVEIADPQRDRHAAGYESAVEDWRQRRADAWEATIESELPDDGCGAFLVWGDPSLYDSTIAVVDEILARGRIALQYDVMPGISSVHALTACHRISLNRVGRAVQITTGRRLADGFPEDVDDVVVMLDAGCTFKTVTEPGVEIYWGAYLGTQDEILISGRLPDVAQEIEQVRAQARERKGWIMDCYLLRRN